jgi:hypothetical protein
MPSEFFRAFFPDELVSPAIAKYAVSEDGDAADLEPVKQKPRRYTVSRERLYPGAKSKGQVKRVKA